LEVPLLLCKIIACFDDKLTELIGNSEMKASRLKHHCYFLMTNLILAELHNKFTSTSLPLFSFAPGDGDEPRGSSKNFIDNKDPELLVPRNHALI